MKTVTVAGMEFEVLTPKEAEAATHSCKHRWVPHTKEVIVNPAGEYVKGYGSRFVSVRIAAGKRCSKCGKFVPAKSLLETSQGNISRILEHRSYRETICELLRELRNEVATTSKIDKCLLMAKRMNDKLVEYAGTSWENSTYDREGNMVDAGGDLRKGADTVTIKVGEFEGTALSITQHTTVEVLSGGILRSLVAEKALVQRISGLLGEPVRVRITDNGYLLDVKPISVSGQGEPAKEETGMKRAKKRTAGGKE